MDTEFPINVNQVIRVVEEAEVFVVGFLLFGERLLVDTRSGPGYGPLIQVVPGVSSVEERYETLRQLRPNLPLPDKFVFFVWPRSVTSLERMGIWQRIVDRCTSGYPQMAEVCRKSLDELLRLEQRQAMAAVRGEGYKSIWKRGEEG